MDGSSGISLARFETMLRRCMPANNRVVFDTLPFSPCIHLAFFVHRIEGLEPGVYILVRNSEDENFMRDNFSLETSDGPVIEGLAFFLLEKGDVRHMAAQLSCGQSIAGNGAFSLGMIARFDETISQFGPWMYRYLFWETGAIGQALYLEAEAAGLQATGIGCFFDDPVHEALKIRGKSYQSLYHFTVGGAVRDDRLTTLPAYPPPE